MLSGCFGNKTLHRRRTCSTVRCGHIPKIRSLSLPCGVARYGQRRFDDAADRFLQVIQVDPTIEQPYIFLGRMLDQAGTHLDQITKAYESWAARNPQNAQAQMLLAKARLVNDPKDAEAETLLERSVSLDSSNWEAHYELGVLLAAKRDYRKGCCGIVSRQPTRSETAYAALSSCPGLRSARRSGTGEGGARGASGADQPAAPVGAD